LRRARNVFSILIFGAALKFSTIFVPAKPGVGFPHAPGRPELERKSIPDKAALARGDETGGRYCRDSMGALIRSFDVR
jgi:hypothetical protein